VIRKIAIFALIINISWFAAEAQTRVTFMAEDGLEVVADSYLIHDSLPWILMFHQSGSSRGEFREIAPRLNMLGYNCLAVDLRYGKESNFITNETSRAAQAGNFPRSMQDARADMIAAIGWASRKSGQPVILFGSSFSASLAMIIAKNNQLISAVIAFSPGEFFGPHDLVHNAVRNLDIPVFIAASRREYPYVTELSSGISNGKKVIFTPSESQGVHGARALWGSEEGSPEYWLGLIMFIHHIKTRD